MTRKIIEDKTRLKLGLSSETISKRMHLESGLFPEQRLTCANHSDNEIVLDKIGWNHFICPKCGRDYSIGRKIASIPDKISNHSPRKIEFSVVRYITA